MEDKRKIGLVVLGAFLLGGLAGVFIFPSKEIIKKEEVIREVEVEKFVDRIVEVEKEVVREVVKREKTTKRKITLPDGTIMEEEITESSEDQLERIEQQVRDSYEQRIALKDKEIRELSSRTRINYKKLNVLVGVDQDRDFAASLSYSVLGPLSVGAIGTHRGDFYLGLGLSF